MGMLKATHAQIRISDQFPHVMRLDLFVDMDRDQIRDCIDGAAVRHFQSESILLREGQFADAIYLLVHGTLDITRSDADGRRGLLHRGGAGTLVGDVETMGEIPCIATCETGAAATLIGFTRGQFHEMLGLPLFTRNLSRIQAQRLHRANLLRTLDNFVPIEQRLATYLCYLADRNSVVVANQNFLADIVGCSRQTVNRVLRSLRDQGLIETHNSWIRVLEGTGCRH